MIEKLFQNGAPAIKVDGLKAIGSATSGLITAIVGIIAGIAGLILFVTIIYQWSKNSGADAQQRRENNKKIAWVI